MLSSVLICAALLTPHHVPATYKIRHQTCVRVADAAREAGLNPITLVSVGWVESGMLPKEVSSKGAVGPLQVLPKYFCPQGRLRGCDMTAAGIRAFQTWKKHYPELPNTLCHYNAGWKCSKNSRRYAAKVLAVKSKLEVALFRLKL